MNPDRIGEIPRLPGDGLFYVPFSTATGAFVFLLA
jgi:hypothetical protein